MATTTEPKKTLRFLSMNELTDSLKRIVGRLEPHLGFAFTTFLLLGITYAVYSVGQTVSAPFVAPTNSPEQSTFSTQFDNATITKVRNLSDTTQTAPSITLPGGRINPFAE